MVSASGASAVFYTLLEAKDHHDKIKDVVDGCKAIVTTYKDSSISPTMKAVESAAELALITARLSELTVKNPSVLPALNVLGTVAEVTIAVINSKNQSSRRVFINAGCSLLSGTGELLKNMANLSSNYRLSMKIAGKVCSYSGTAIGFLTKE